jgi:hypothetical protein
VEAGADRPTAIDVALVGQDPGVFDVPFTLEVGERTFASFLRATVLASPQPEPPA